MLPRSQASRKKPAWICAEHVSIPEDIQIMIMTDAYDFESNISYCYGHNISVPGPEYHKTTRYRQTRVIVTPCYKAVCLYS
jgi:hypothetical protein